MATAIDASARDRVVGSNLRIFGSRKLVIGDHNIVSGVDILVFGNHNQVSGVCNSVHGDFNTVVGRSSKAVGRNNTVKSTSDPQSLKSQPTPPPATPTVMVGHVPTNDTKEVVSPPTSSVETPQKAENSFSYFDQCPEIWSELNESADSPIKDSGSDDGGPSKCVICYENPRQIAFLPCYHAVACVGCAKRLDEETKGNGCRCPVCRTTSTSAVKILGPAGSASAPCTVCKSNARKVLLMPCNHMLHCIKCANEFKKAAGKPGEGCQKCPECNEVVVSAKVVFHT